MGIHGKRLGRDASPYQVDALPDQGDETWRFRCLGRASGPSRAASARIEIEIEIGIEIANVNVNVNVNGHGPVFPFDPDTDPDPDGTDRPRRWRTRLWSGHLPSRTRGEVCP
jgi:hypothetical protein